LGSLVFAAETVALTALERSASRVLLWYIPPVHPDLERLIQLQALDSRVAEARRLQITIPETQRALDDRLEGASGAVAATKERLAANNASRRDL